MVACFRAVCWGDDHELGRQQTWREEKVNGLAKHAAIIHRARYNTQLRGEIHEEEEMDGDSDEEIWPDEDLNEHWQDVSGDSTCSGDKEGL